jgi:hypothetical protein
MTKTNIVRPFRKTRKRFYIYFYSDDEKSNISLFKYNIKNPTTTTGSLQFCSQNILHKHISHVKIHFPLKNPVKATILYKSNITLKKIIHIIQTIYKHIYDIEEITSTPIEYTYYEQCNDCVDISKYIQVENKLSTEKCSICLSNLSDNETCLLKCCHYFHKHCLLQWCIYGNGKTCPICRKYISNCDKCKGKQIINIISEGKIIPKKYRDDENIRNNTNGIFKIYKYDLEKLLLNFMYVNNETSELNIYVSV